MSSTTPSSTPVDTAALSTKVRNYLKTNQIQLSRFSTLVLGVSQARLSTLLVKPQPWHLLSTKVQALYQRMQLWMDTRATYGNNPYQVEKTVTGTSKKQVRSLFDLEENMEILKQLEDFTAAQYVAEENRDCEYEATGLGVVTGTSAKEGIEDGVGDEDMNHAILEHSGDQKGELSQDMVSLGDLGLEEKDLAFNYRLEEQEVNLMDIPEECQVMLQDNPDQPGTFKLTFIQFIEE